MTIMLSKYLHVPLRYELVYCGSRSLVRDNIAFGGNGFTFPLFRRETERRRFEKAVGLLRADVKEICFVRGVPKYRQRTLLGNLKAILDHEQAARGKFDGS